MFSRVALFITAALSVCAIANPTPSSEPTGRCATGSDTGTLQCCKSLDAPNTTKASHELKLAGVDPKSVKGQVGVGCSPILLDPQRVGGTGSNGGCSDATACCKKYDKNHHVGVDCNPIHIS